jgi:hypothetical protein
LIHTKYRGLKQSDRLILEDCGLTERYMKRSLEARIKDGQSIKEIWIKKKDNIIKLFP